MAYRRRQGFAKDSTSSEEFRIPSPDSRRHSSPTSLEDGSSSSAAASATPSLAAKAIRASSANRDSALSSAYGQPAISPRTAKSNPLRSSQSSTPKDDSMKYDYTSMKNLEKPKPGFWGGLARKARSIIEDDDEPQQYETPERRRQQMSDPKNSIQDQFPESHEKTDNPGFQKGLGAIASSLNYIGGTIGNALEEGRTIVENKTADIIQETRKLHVKKKSGIIPDQTQTSNKQFQPPQPLLQTDVEIQLKASRDVSMAMAAKAKLLLRELKTVKADLAFAKERCAHLEEENKILRETRGDGDNQEDDDLIRLQLESLLAEKARLAQENSVYARENRFLREIVEYHQLTMQDVVYIDENNEEVTQVYQPPINNLSSTHDLQLQSIIIPTLPSTPPNTNSQLQYLSPKTPFAPNTPFM
ncbi:uncharacterized protein LOC111908442 [Lactuca sativa]|uniref:Uncharacterized protein n=1 Tax=Lactuca sativa TaxID=4236 RepID=A0A9R1WQ75_LACSA|nr:uncharacterized protein LOC111908442 [Lactuca sativa]KAJ0186790.1 hypothetical protein LSAT_V11C900461790 [Lactuca sativa]